MQNVYELQHQIYLLLKLGLVCSFGGPVSLLVTFKAWRWAGIQ